MAKDMQLFNKLSEEDQLKQIELFISSYPADQQEAVRKAILG